MSDNKKKKLKEYLYPETAKDALVKWDKGESVFTVEMGGLGPGYEQCIHIVCFEIIRQADAITLEKLKKDNRKLNDYLDKIIFASEKCKELGLSGAQAGAAKNLACHYILKGYRVSLEEPEIQDRLIQVSKNFPE